MRPLVVSGIGCVSAFGASAPVFADRLLAGETGIAPIAGFSTERCRSHCAARVRDFDAAKFLPPAKLRRLDAVTKVAVAASALALDDAGLRPPPDPGRVGVVLGSATAGVQSTGEYLESLMRGGPLGAPALIFASTVGNSAASVCGLELALRGPNTTISHKEASGLAAVAFAAQLVDRGKAAALLCGGADDIYERFFLVHDWFRVLSPGDGGPEGARPFDAARNGFVMGEGAFMIVLEDAASCAARHRSPYGELLGVGASSAPEPVNAWPSSSDALTRAMRLALEEAGVRPSEIGAVYASANGTRELDRVEAEAIAEVFGPVGVPVTSIKGAIGEFGAAGAASLVAALLCGRDGLIAPTVGCAEVDADCAVAVSSAVRPLDRPLVLVNSFASGGTHHSLVARVHPPLP